AIKHIATELSQYFKVLIADPCEGGELDSTTDWDDVSEEEIIEIFAHKLKSVISYKLSRI
ncbi:MAG: hypothetical protein SNG27_08765, partial [Rikenellaceae bacterium]